MVATPIGSSSGIRDILTPQAPSSALMNQTEVSTPSSSGPPKRMRVRESSLSSPQLLQHLQQGDTDLLASIKQEDDDPTDEIRPPLEPEPIALNLLLSKR